MTVLHKISMSKTKYPMYKIICEYREIPFTMLINLCSALQRCVILQCYHERSICILFKLCVHPGKLTQGLWSNHKQWETVSFLSEEVLLPVCPRSPAWTNRQTHTTESITFPSTTYTVGNHGRVVISFCTYNFDRKWYELEEFPWRSYLITVMRFSVACKP